MCGISGFNWPDKGLIQGMNRVNKYRGPDSVHFYCDNTISLGHTRLAILDLSPHGEQPLYNEDNSLMLVYNGEIYNFKEIRADLIEKGHLFSSKTDSEVIIHAYEEYGINCLDRFNGMWAFCLYDRMHNVCILARDRFGIKPLYYYSDTDRFIFSSMISALLLHDLKIGPNNRIIMDFLCFNLQCHTNETFFSSVLSLEPGCFLTYDLKERKLKTQRWYFPKKRNSNRETIKNTFIKAVRDRTVADVAIGCCLSGGLDSSAIATVLASHLDSVPTFSLVAPDSPFDESIYIGEMNRSISAHPHSTEISASGLYSDLLDFIRCQEEPVTGLSPYAQYAVMRCAHEAGVKVVLDGQGGDELFAGYIYYYGWYFYELLRNKKILQLGSEIIYYLKRNSHLLPIKMFFGLLLPQKFLCVWKRFDKTWINHEYARTVHTTRDPRWNRLTLEEGLQLTLYKTAIPHLLQWEDKNSMRWSVESRLPFLDFNLVEQAISIPSGQKIGHGKTKIIFRDAMEDLIPELIRKRTDKIGFEVPVDDIMRDNRMADFARKIFYSEKFVRRPYWNAPAAQNLLEMHLMNKTNAGDEIWKMLHLEIWLCLFIEKEIPFNLNETPDV